MKTIAITRLFEPVEDKPGYYWFLFEPVEDKPGYYWFNKRNHQIISKEVLERAIKEYENRNQLFLPN